MNKHSLPRATTALLLVDVINPLDFPGAGDLARTAVTAARAIRSLKARLRKEGVPAIYANDNYGAWDSNFDALIRKCESSNGPAAELVRLLRPKSGDLTLLKPRHSAFLGTPLDLMLSKIGAKTIILCGFATDICLQLTAMDAFLRGYRVKTPADCTAAESEEFRQQSLDYMERVLRCDVIPSR